MWLMSYEISEEEKETTLLFVLTTGLHLSAIPVSAVH